jgi:uncharacterized protein (DUF486 family)
MLARRVEKGKSATPWVILAPGFNSWQHGDYDYDTAAYPLQHFYDFCVVRTKYRQVPLFKVIVISWLIAFLEYCFQVPANRIGSYEFTAVQLKTIQKVISLTVFSVFAVLYLGEKLKWNYLVGFGLIVSAVFVIFKKW